MSASALRVRSCTFCTISAGSLPLGHGQQGATIESAQHQDHNLEAHCGDISDDHCDSLGSPGESTEG